MDTLEMLAEYYQDLLNATGGKVTPEEIEINMRVLVGRWCHRVSGENAGKVFFCRGYAVPHFWWKDPDLGNYEHQPFINRCSEHPERRAELPPADHYQRTKKAVA